MKQGDMAISFEEEKLAALRRYMGKKELDLEAELTDALTNPVREYIDETDAPAPRRAQTEAQSEACRPQAR